jgi:hypoxanthine phosphoribosyltransferase
MQNKYILHWDAIEDHVASIAKQITKSKFVPEYIVAITRGGYIPARLLCNHFAIKEILPFQIHSYTNRILLNSTLQRPFQYTFIKCHNVLIVDDIADSGNTLETVGSTILQLHTNIKTATLLAKRGCTIKPDYCGCRNVPKRVWAVFPWENQ